MVLQLCDLVVKSGDFALQLLGVMLDVLAGMVFESGGVGHLARGVAYVQHGLAVHEHARAGSLLFILAILQVGLEGIFDLTDWPGLHELRAGHFN